METVAHHVDNRDGWRLSLHQTWSPPHLVAGRHPVVIVPGYGMNSFIFSYHPSGVSLEGFLAEAGFEVWRADLRAQGGSVSTGGTDNFSLADLALTDLGAVVDAVLQHTRTGADRADVIGASLGGTLLYVHAALRRDHRLGSIVAMGSPLRWEKVHPVIKLAFSSPWLAGLVRFKGTRRLAERLLPLLAKRVPWVLSIYLNPEVTDVSAAREMVRTVEDPNRRINREIAHWVRAKDLTIDGTNITNALGVITAPLLCVVANGDGIVPRETAVFPTTRVSSKIRAVLTVGTDELKLAHADMFISREAHERVFAPIARWLAEPSSQV